MIMLEQHQKTPFSERMDGIPKSFIRQILKATQQPNMISFAGGLPNATKFPLEALQHATTDVFQKYGGEVFQYAITEGFFPLRQWISDRYNRKYGMKVTPEEILITSGSQQGMDLIGKLFLNKGDHIVMERPGYLGAIQTFSIFQPDISTVSITEDGANLMELSSRLNERAAKFFYTVPNFQNPSGVSYSQKKRARLASLLKMNDCWLIEDDPYNELRYSGSDLPPIKVQMGEKGILLGSFSKTIAPSLRIGWIVAVPTVIDQLRILKQASDLHTNEFGQRLLYEYLLKNDFDEHLSLLKNDYHRKLKCMLQALGKYFPANTRYYEPEGGMFIWCALPKTMDAYRLLEEAMKQQVIFVPGDVFFQQKHNTHYLRLNFTNSSLSEIDKGIKILGRLIKQGSG